MAKSADAFRTISEVADWLGVQSHVLRFWESKFAQVKPVKRAGGRRYYRPADMLLLGGIRKLLHDDGLTIKGVQKILREEGVAHVADLSPPLDEDTSATLDRDLVTRLGDDVEMSAQDEDAPFGLDHAPLPPRVPDGAPDGEEADDDGPRRDTVLPSFMRASEPAPDPDAEPVPRAPDIPTLTPDFVPAEQASASADRAEEPQGPFGATDTPEMVDMWDEAPEPIQSPAEPVPTSVATSPPVQDPVEDEPPAPTPADEPTPALQPGPAPEVEAAPARETDAAPAAAEAAPLPGDEPAPAPEIKAASFASLKDAPQKDVQPEAEADIEPLPVFSRPPPPEPTPEPAAEPVAEAAPKPRPRVIDIPDETDTSSEDIAPSALTKAVMLRKLTPAQVNGLRPLVAQLTALRDQMARARHDPR